MRPALCLSRKGAKIVFAGSDGEERTLYYFRTDLSNKGVPNSGFLKFCESFGQGDAFVKSASYLLHNARLFRGSGFPAEEHGFARSG